MHDKTGRMKEPKVCALHSCINSFISVRSNHKYCSKECRKIAYGANGALTQKRNKTHAPKRCSCDECDVIFTPLRSFQIYCSKKCCKRQWDLDHIQRHCAQSRKYKEEHRDESRLYSRKWSRENPDKRIIQHHKRRARVKGNGGSFTVAELNEQFERQEGFCYYCGELLYASFDKSVNVEHMIPISRGGSNDISNIVLSCSRCNFEKHTKTHEEFMEMIK